MAKNQPKETVLPEFLRPKARLFLSVDLVGSTAFKQFPKFPIGAPVDQKEWSGIASPWLSPIADFFSEFGVVFEELWEEYTSETAPAHSLPIGQPPELWKANGDELIFVKELSDRRELFATVLLWMKAVERYRVDIKKLGRLDVKSCIWFAGFPITNAEIVVKRSQDATISDFRDDARLRQFDLLERWYRDETSRKNLVRDFIGPSIDTGFRLASIASPRKLVVSVEVAYFLASAHHDGEKGDDGFLVFPKVRYDGRIELKGVLGGKPYPVFWIDLHFNDKKKQAEDKLLGKRDPHSREDVLSFCSYFFDEQEHLMLKPFIHGEPDTQFGKIPANYMESLAILNAKWRNEKKRYESERSSESAVGSGTRRLQANDKSALISKLSAAVLPADLETKSAKPKKMKPRHQASSGKPISRRK